MNRSASAAGITAAVAEGITALDVELAVEPAVAAEQLAAYIAAVVRWNRVYNLTAVRDPVAMVPQHLLDSLTVLPWLTGPAVLDVGSGAGLPGIPLAIARPDLGFTLLDSSAKRTRFIQQAIAELKLSNVTVTRARVEQFVPAGATAQQGYDCVLSRAFASLADFARMAGPLASPSGRLLAMKGTYPAAELTELPAAYRVVEVATLQVPGLDAERHLVVLRHT